MRLPRTLLVLLLAVALPGCTWGREDESAVDKGEYDGGIGVALAVRNGSPEPFEVTVVLLGVGNAEIARFEERLEANQSVEKWYPLDAHGLYSARMSYEWSGTGRSAHGNEDYTIDTSQCPALSRVAWELRQQDGQVGSAFLGKTCLNEDGTTNTTR